MSYQNRKAVAKAFLVLMLTAIISFGIVLFAMNQFFTRADQEVNEQACRASILTRVKSLMRIKLGPISHEVDPFPIICKTQQKVLEGDKDQVMMQISDLSARCWWMFLNGEYRNIFNKNYFFSENMCFICYTFSIDEKMSIKGDELMDYMDEHYYITHGGEEGEEEGVTYLDYIQIWKGKGAIATSKGIEFVGDKEKIYTINFLSPDLTLVGELLSTAEDAGMNVIYIEQRGANKELKKECKFLESI